MAREGRVVLVKITSDFACPWCFLGINRFERAINNLKSPYTFLVEWVNPPHLPFRTELTVGASAEIPPNPRFAPWIVAKRLTASVPRRVAYASKFRGDEAKLSAFEFEMNALFASEGAALALADG